MSNYRLHVDITVAQEHAHAYEAKIAAFVAQANPFGTIDRNFRGVLPILLLKANKRSGSDNHYIHLWQLPQLDLNQAALMENALDNNGYRAIDALVATETQELIVINSAKASTKMLANVHFAKKPTVIIRVTNTFTAPADYVQYSNKVLDIIDVLEESGWTNYGVCWSVTGRLRTFTEFWQPNGEATIIDTLKSAQGVPAGTVAYYKTLSPTVDVCTSYVP